MQSSKDYFGFKLIAILLVVVTVVTLIPKNLTAHAFESASQPDLAGTITAEDAEQYSIVSRDQASEIDLNSLIFNTKNGEKAEFFYPYDVKYIDDEGLVHDKDTTISKTEGGFVSARTGVNISFSCKLSDGVSVASFDNKYSVFFAPLDSTDSYSDGTLADDNSTVRYTGSKSSFEYGATFAGIKENIVLNEYSGVNSWSFRLLTNGLTLCETDGQYVLSDGDSSVMFFGSILAFTADDRNNTFGAMTVEPVAEAEEYVLTVSVSDEWLKSDDTSYPVTIDPSITVNYATGPSAIQDEILSSTSTYSVTYDVLYIGKRNNNEKLRGAICFPGLDLSGKTITSACLELRDVMCDDEVSELVELYEYTGNTWSENTTLTWSDAQNYDNLLDSHYVIYGNGNVASSTNRYSFNITMLAQKWAAGLSSPSQGVLIKSTDDFESSSNTFHVCFASKDYGSNTHKPSLIITYVEPKGYNPSYTFDSRTLDDKITVYNFHNYGNVLMTYDFDVKTKGFPIPLFYAYNSFDDSWRLSVEETFSQDAGRYCYTDGYGTDYYFIFREPGKYENETLGLEISVTSSYISFDTGDGIKKIFSASSGKITSIEYDKDTYSYTYGAYGLTGIYKNGTELFSFAYTSGKLSSAFGYAFGYTNGVLTSVSDRYSNKTNITRSYTSGEILSSLDIKSALTTNGINLTFNTNTKKVSRIITYRGSTLFNITDDSYSYSTGSTSVSSNLANIDVNDPMNTRTTYVFDYTGRTVNEFISTLEYPSICISASDYRTDNIASGDIIGGCVQNLLSNSSFESSSWNNGFAISSDEAVFGSKIMSILSASNAYTYIYPSAGTFCFSVYLKGENAKGKLSVTSMSGNLIAETNVFPLDDTWTRLYLTFEVEYTQILILKITNSGTAPLLADCAQLEKNDSPTTYNVLSNIGFDNGVSGWNGGFAPTYLMYGNCCGVNAGSSVSQTITLGAISENTPFTVAGWFASYFDITSSGEIFIYFNGNQSNGVSVPFNGFASSGISFSCAQILPPEGTGTITSVTFSVKNTSDAGSIYCDNLLLSFGNIARTSEIDNSSIGLAFESNNNGTCKVTGIGSCTDTELIIPSTSPNGDMVIEIAYEAFKNNQTIESVVFPETLRMVNAKAFWNCDSLKSVYFQNSVERLYDAVFAYCSNLEFVYLPDSITQIDGVAFGYCDSLKTVILPRNLEILGGYTFCSCPNLKKITIPVTITDIYSYCFYGDTDIVVYYEGSPYDWSAISIGTNAISSGCTINYNSEVIDNSIYTYAYSGGYKTGVTVTSIDDNSPVAGYKYDNNGNIIEYTDAKGNKTFFTYDSNENLLSTTVAYVRETEYTYDSNDNVLTEKDARGNIESFLYYSNGLLRSREKGGTTISYTYSNGLISDVTISGINPNYSNTYHYTYNSYGNLLSIVMGTSSEVIVSYTYTCGGRGKLASKTESNGYCETYYFDSVGNLKETRFAGNIVYSYCYNLDGNCISSSDMNLQVTEISLIDLDGGVYAFSFDLSGNLIKEVSSEGSVIFANGNYYYSELPEGVSQELNNDVIGRDTEIALKLIQGETESIIYSITKTYYDISTNYAPDEVMTESFSGAKSYQYTYDNCGNLRVIKEKSGNNDPFVIKQKYYYDSKCQLIREDNANTGKTYTWSYDTNGNIQTKCIYNYTSADSIIGSPLETIEYNYDANNEDKLIYFDDTYIYYSGLNPTNWRNADSMSWIGRQLVSRVEGNTTTTYEYNSDGLRTKKTVGNSVTEYTWDNGRLIREVNSDRTISFIYVGNEMIGFATEGSNYYYARDSFGTIKYVYNEDGTIYSEYKYDSWGNLTDDSVLPIGGDINPIRYKGYYYDTDSGFYYLQSRYYDPIIGRFINSDVIDCLDNDTSVNSFNLYVYCENNPVIFSDPTGEAKWNIVAVGIQIEATISVITFGIEVIATLSYPVHIYVFTYGGGSFDYEYFKNIVKYVNDIEKILSKDVFFNFSISFCLFGVFSKKNFNYNTYEGPFTEIYGIVPTPIFGGHLGVKAYYSWGSGYRIGGAGVSFSLGKAGGAGISRTKYKYRPELSSYFSRIELILNFILGKVKNLKH